MTYSEQEITDHITLLKAQDNRMRGFRDMSDSPLARWLRTRRQPRKGVKGAVGWEGGQCQGTQ
jgi:hypothetical protein